MPEFSFTPVSTDIFDPIPSDSWSTSPTFSSAGVIPADNTADNPLGFFQNLLGIGAGLYSTITTAEAKSDAANAAIEASRIKAQSDADIAKANADYKIALLKAQASAAAQPGAVVNWAQYMPYILGGVGIIVLMKFLNKKK